MQIKRMKMVAPGAWGDNNQSMNKALLAPTSKNPVLPVKIKA
jgi:hypothetical protein